MVAFKPQGVAVFRWRLPSDEVILCLQVLPAERIDLCSPYDCGFSFPELWEMALDQASDQEISKPYV